MRKMYRVKQISDGELIEPEIVNENDKNEFSINNENIYSEYDAVGRINEFLVKFADYFGFEYDGEFTILTTYTGDSS